MGWKLDEENGDIDYIVNGDKLILKVKPAVFPTIDIEIPEDPGGNEDNSRPSSLWFLDKQKEYLHLNDDGTISILETGLEVRGNIKATGDVIAFSSSTIEQLYAKASVTNYGLVKIDGKTITINPEGQLVGASDGLDETALAKYLTTNSYVTSSALTGFIKLSSPLSGYSKSDAYTAITPADTILGAFGKLEKNFDNYVDLATDQTIDGKKRFIKDVISQGDIIAFSGSTIESEYAKADQYMYGLVKIDGETITINSDGQLVSNAAGLDETALATYLTSNKYITETILNGKGYITSSALDGYIKLSSPLTGYAKPSSYTALTPADTVIGAFGKLESNFSNYTTAALKMSGYAKAGSYTPISVNDTLNVAVGKLERNFDNYVTLGTTQTITGMKTFSQDLMGLKDIIAYSSSTSIQEVYAIAEPTMYGLVKYDGVSIKRNASGQLYAEAGSGGIGGITISGSGNAISEVTLSADKKNLSFSKGITFWHAGNDGVGSGLDADLFNGKYLNYFSYNRGSINTLSSADNITGNGFWQFNDSVTVGRPVSYAVVSQIGNMAGVTPGVVNNWVHQTFYGTDGNIYVRNRTNLDSWSAFSTIAYTTSNVASATKLQNARNINGTPFDGTAPVTTNTWGTARNMSIASHDNTGLGTKVSVNGFSDYVLFLPSTIKATLQGNATSASTATKLTTVRKIFGQNFDGTGDVNGSLYNVNDIYMGNNNRVYSADSTGVNVTTFELNASNILLMGWGSSTKGYDTHINGNNIHFRYGTSHTPGILLNSSGNVGIGTVTPSAKLDVNGNILAKSGYFTTGIMLSNAVPIAFANNTGSYLNSLILDTNNNLLLGFSTSERGYNTYVEGYNVQLRYGAAHTTGIYLGSNGFVGINNNAPGYRLDIGGNIKATSMIVTDEWFQNRTADKGLQNLANGAQWYANANGWNSNKNVISTGDLIAYSGSTITDIYAIASATTFGLVKIGEGLSIDPATGILSSTGSGGTIGDIGFTGTGNVVTGVTLSVDKSILTFAKGMTALDTAGLLSYLTSNNYAKTSSNVASATKLQTPRGINGTAFDGTMAITTAFWGTARTFAISSSDGWNPGVGSSVNGSGNVTLRLPSEIKATLQGNATSATSATSAQYLSGYTYNQFMYRDDAGQGHEAASSVTYSKYGFGYTTDGWPTTGSYISFGGLNNNYVTQIQGNYMDSSLAFLRTLNGDTNVFNPWVRLLSVSGSTNLLNVGSLTVNGYIYSRSWFQNNIDGAGLFNVANNARWYATGGVWHSDKIIQIDTSGQWAQLGCQSSVYCHFMTSAGAFYFNKEIHIDGKLLPYGGYRDIGTYSNPFGDIYSQNWFRACGDTGWYNQKWGGGMNMSGLNWVDMFGKPLRSTVSQPIGCSSFNVNAQFGAFGAGHSGIEIAASDNVFGIGVHTNDNVYFWGGTSCSQDSVAGKAYIGQINLIDKSFNWFGNIVSQGNIIANGDVVAYSDMRKKNYRRDFTLDIRDFTRAPLFYYTRKDDNRGREIVGTSAQWMVERLRECVLGTGIGDDYYSFAYGKAGFLLATSTIKTLVPWMDEKDRKIVELEERIKYLESKIAS